MLYTDIHPELVHVTHTRTQTHRYTNTHAHISDISMNPEGWVVMVLETVRVWQ